MNTKLSTFAQVRALAHWPAQAFACTLLERMLPNYQLFCELTDSGDPAVLRNALDNLWQHLGNNKHKVNFALQIDKVEEVIPDPADFDNFGVYPAVDAGMALVAALQLAQQVDLQGAVVVSKLSQGSVEAFIDATSEQTLDNQEIKAHPLMQWEVDFQQGLLGELADLPANATSCQQLREMARQEGVSNLGLSLG